MTPVVKAKKLGRFDPKTFLSTLDGGRKIETVPKKQTIFVQGESSDAVFYIQKGKVKLTVVSETGKEATIGILNEGEFFGEACDLPPIFSPGIMRLSPVLGSPTLHLQSHSHQRKKRLRPAEPCERSRTEPRSSAQTPLV